MSLLLSAYHHLPAPARSLAASMRGMYLRAWRYGPETVRLIEEALEREHWPSDKLISWQEERLAYLLHRAATRVPYYREHWAARRRKGDKSSHERLENWPVLQKEDLRENPTAFIADDCDPRRMFRERTSGTTGKPLSLWFSKASLRLWFALFEARTRHWNGVRRQDNWAILGGQFVIPAKTQRPPFWVWNAPMRQLYLSSNHISSQNIPAYVAALNESNVTHLIAYSSSATLLAREAYNLNLKVPSLKTVITNAEPLFSWQREAIERGLGCKVRETYGMAEAVLAASECTEGQLHLWPETGWLEILNDVEEIPVRPDESGRLICTGLLNTDMPLVRYAVGDRGQGGKTDVHCGCGRALPTIGGIEGRTNDLLLTPDGRRIYWLNPVFYDIPLQEAQIIQEALDRVRVRYVPAANFTQKDSRIIAERLAARVGEVEIVMERVGAIPRQANGKFKAIICNL